MVVSLIQYNKFNFKQSDLIKLVIHVFECPQKITDLAFTNTLGKRKLVAGWAGGPGARLTLAGDMHLHHATYCPLPIYILVSSFNDPGS